MKAVVQLPNGTRIELEGTEAEVSRALEAYKTPIVLKEYVYVSYPVYVPPPAYNPLYPNTYRWISPSPIGLGGVTSTITVKGQDVAAIPSSTGVINGSGNFAVVNTGSGAMIS